VQFILNKKTNKKVIKHSFAFRRLITCKYCSYSLIGEIQKGTTYYRCHTKGCSTKGIREKFLHNKIMEMLKTTELQPEESEKLNDLLNEMNSEWATKQTDLLQAIKFQKKNTEGLLERLTDCYIEGGLNKDTYESRKEKLLVEITEKENAHAELTTGKTRIIRKVKNFLELSKKLIKSYETGIWEEKRELLETVTSNLMIEGKKLIVSMRSPFSEMAKHCFWDLCGHTADTTRKTQGENANVSEPDLPARKPLTDEQLKSLLDVIIDAVSKLPEDNPEAEYDL
jgi:site-specific DNA recombinase